MSDVDLPKGLTMHRGKLRIAFRPPNEKNQWKRSLGIPPTKANIKAAEQMLNSIRRDISLGQFNIADYFPNDPSLKKDAQFLSQVLDTYFLKSKEGRVKGSSHLQYVAHVKAINRIAGVVDIANLSQAEAKQFRDSIIKGSPSQPSASFRLWIVRDAISRAVRELAIDSDPFGAMLAPAEKESKAISVNRELEASGGTDVYTLAEAEKLIKACNNDNKRRLLQFMFWSGIRPGEAAALRREDVCLPYIIVRRTLTHNGAEQTPKTGRERKIYLPSSARSVLEQQLQTHGFERVWLTSKGKMYQRSVLFATSTWRELCEKAGVPFRKPYSTRHSFASWMLKAGEPASTVAAHLGHVDVRMIHKVYGKFIPDANPVWTLDDPTKIESFKKSTISSS